MSLIISESSKVNGQPGDISYTVKHSGGLLLGWYRATTAWTLKSLWGLGVMSRLVFLLYLMKLDILVLLKECSHISLCEASACKKSTYLALASWTWGGLLLTLSQGRNPHNQWRRQKPKIWRSPRLDGAIETESLSEKKKTSDIWLALILRSDSDLHKD